MMKIDKFVQNIAFKRLRPDDEIRGVDEIENTLLPEDFEIIREDIGPLLKMRRMSSFAIGAILWKAVREMPVNQLFLNIGLYHGFTFIAGCKGSNDEKTCIGVDSYVKWQDAADHFIDYMNKRAGNKTYFFRESFETFFKLHMPQFDKKIGVYFYDADHGEKATIKALQLAEPFMSKDCIVMLDDINLACVRRAMGAYFDSRKWEQLFNARTAGNGHPTYWNGLAIFQRRHRS